MGVAKHSNQCPVGFQKKGIKRRLQQGEGKSLVASSDVYCDIFESLTARSSTSFLKKNTSCSTMSAAFGFGCCQRWLQNSRVRWCSGTRSCSKRGGLANLRNPFGWRQIQHPNCDSFSRKHVTCPGLGLAGAKCLWITFRTWRYQSKLWFGSQKPNHKIHQNQCMNHDCNMTWQLQPWLKPS